MRTPFISTKRADVRVNTGGLGGGEESQGRAIAQCRGRFSQLDPG
jgi:hypothetical protein